MIIYIKIISYILQLHNFSIKRYAYIIIDGCYLSSNGNYKID